MADTPITLQSDRGTVLLTDGPPGYDFTQLPGVLFDPRTSTYRAQGRHYRAVIEHLVREKIPFTDSARGWENKDAGWKLKVDWPPHWYQTEALDTWVKTGRRGLVILPTGTGKTFLGALVIQKVSRPTIVVVPTLDLLRQWVGQLADFFGVEVGAVGGGDYFFKPLTVITYDSARIHAERWANKFGLLIYDEVHHLPGPSYAETAIAALAPFRLGLTATPERADGGETIYPELVGPIAYRREITELSGDFLAEYQAKRVLIDLTEEEAETYKSSREVYRQFVADRGISFGSQSGWQRFIFEASRSPEGWKAMRAYRQQKEIERAASGKLAMLEKLMLQHVGERIIVFTADNATVYKIARKYLVPPITHQTKVKERKQILERINSGEYTVVVTSQVLNEGVDVPAASVGIVLSGTGSTRENVQRLGRILRKYKGKQAVLYEVVARGTAEEFTSDRRRQHGAFQ
ncbi:DEAD/DEAH box helicase family protein [Limnoglobus roseus]|uniref:ATP-dependent helicase n=1 Tax=Limnoglobus roseus TaxID=2598579 RepID=A0A5C1A7I1_9BACT|nr:DEAD/DEAH box helicase family protein [Limnoglobus roseus]QEL13188.1 ATP-dependent helicase [Limnoglobus roseus]